MNCVFAGLKHLIPPSWAIIIFRGGVKVSFKSDSIFLNPYFMVNFMDVV